MLELRINVMLNQMPLIPLEWVTYWYVGVNNTISGWPNQEWLCIEATHEAKNTG